MGYKALMSIFKDESGATALEYGLIAALIAAVIIGAVSQLGTAVRTTFETVAGAMPTAGGGGAGGGS